MRPVQARFITVCQQLLALGVVLAVLTPAAAVLSLDIVGGTADQRGPGVSAPLRGALSSATVPDAPVESQVTEVPLTTQAGSARTLAGKTVQRRSLTASRITSRPQPVTGYGAIGVTWAPSAELDDHDLTVRVRTREGEQWSGWTEVEYHDDHGPDSDSAEARDARPGTDPLIVGEVDAVQVKAAVDGEHVTELPADLKLAVVEPGTAQGSTKQTPDAGGKTSYDDEFDRRDGDDALSLQAATTGVASRKASMPTIYSRAQWGANESIRNTKNLRYGTVSGGFVHHTVNANNYSEAQVPGILRSIYAYHVKSRGWSDIGYNFLVDRFGRIWEGRYGGIDKNVVGAHTLGYNDYSFAMSAIGNFETVEAPDVMLRAYGALFAWKLGINGVNPASSSQQIGKKVFPAISGHRDAGSTACPGKYLYAKLPTIRAYAAAAPAPAPTPAPDTPPAPVEIGEPTPQSNLAGDGFPDLVVRRTSDGHGFVVPTGGLTGFRKAATLAKKGWANRSSAFVSPDLTGDGVIDVVSASRKGVLRVRPGRGDGKFKATSKVVKATKGHTMFAAVGDVDKDGRNDLVARHKGRLVLLSGTKKGGFKRTVLGKGMGNYSHFVGVGDQNGDGNPDLLARHVKGSLHLFPGDGTGAFSTRSRLAGSWPYSQVVGGADFNGDGRADLVGRTRKGKVFLHLSRGDGTFSPAVGPAANVRALRSLSVAGNLVGGPGPDLVGVKGDSLMVAANKDSFEVGAPIDTGVSFAESVRLITAGDWDRDGSGDVISQTKDGGLWLYRGNGTGQLAAPTQIGWGFGTITNLTAVGDVTGDDYPDLLGTHSSGQTWVFGGTGSGLADGRAVAGRPVTRPGLPADLSGFDWVIPVSDIKAKGAGDYLVRQAGTGTLLLYAGTKSGVAKPRFLSEGLGGYDLAG